MTLFEHWFPGGAQRVARIHLDEAGEPVVDHAPDDPRATLPALGRAWRQLSPHPAIVETRVCSSSTIVLRYVATRSEPPVWRSVTVASCAVQLALAYQHINGVIPRDDHWLFSRPQGVLDVEDHLRLVFMPPLARRGSVRLHDVVATIWRELAVLTNDEGLGERLGRSYSSFDAGIAEIAAHVPGTRFVREASQHAAWRDAEAGLGLIALDETAQGRARLRRALAVFPSPATVRELERAPLPSARYVTPTYRWPDVQARLDALEAERDFASALAIYSSLEAPADARALITLRHARCLHDAGNFLHAADKALQATQLAPAVIESHLLLVRSLLGLKLHAEALERAEMALSVDSYDAMAHYLRGKALISCGRPDEARDAFDLALALQPTLLEAILLRRQVHANLVALGRSVGAQRVTLELPESLEPLREVLATGRIRHIIEALSAPVIAEDLDAQLVLARFLALDGKRDAAITIFERLIGTRVGFAAMIGKAEVLLALGHHAAALAYFDALVAERRDSVEASEGRARALDKLGRPGEAAAEFRRLVALLDAESSLRARLARTWLDAHPL